MTVAIDMRRWRAEHPAFNADDYLPDDSETQNVVTAVRALDAPPTEPPRWRVQALLPDNDFCIVAGEDGVSKSTAALHIACAIAGGYDVFNAFHTERGPVLIVSEEDDRNTILIRANALIAGHGWDRERVLSNLHILALEGVNVSEREWQRTLAAEIQRTEAVMLILDPLAELIDGDENDNSAARPVLKWIRSLPCATTVVHHFGKAAEGRSDGDRIRGASAWRRAARAILTLEALGDSNRVRVKPLKLTKARKHPPFVFTRTIEADSDNEANWRRATLVYESERRGRLAAAREWVLARIDDSDFGLLSTELRTLAVGSGFTAENVGDAVRELSESEGPDRIEHYRMVDDHANARRWRRVRMLDAANTADAAPVVVPF